MKRETGHRRERGAIYSVDAALFLEPISAAVAMQTNVTNRSPAELIHATVFLIAHVTQEEGPLVRCLLLVHRHAAHRCSVSPAPRSAETERGALIPNPVGGAAESKADAGEIHLSLVPLESRKVTQLSGSKIQYLNLSSMSLSSVSPSELHNPFLMHL